MCFAPLFYSLRHKPPSQNSCQLRWIKCIIATHEKRKKKEMEGRKKEITNNPNLSPKDIQPDSWFKVNRDTALKYNKKSTPVIKDGNDYYVGLKTGNMNEKTMNSHIDLLTDKGIGKEMNKEKVAAKSMAIA